MRRLFVLGTIFVGLLVAFGLAGEDGFQTARRAEAVVTTTTWTYPSSGGITATGSVATTGTVTTPAACTSCYITGIVPDLVYMNDPDPTNHPEGSTANFNNNSLDNVWLHHMVVVDGCNINNRIFASGNERMTWSLPSGYGYSQGACPWVVNYHIHNSSNFTRGVALKLVVTYQTGVTLTPVTPVWLDMSSDLVNPSEYTIPIGYRDTHTGPGVTGISNDWTSTIQGQIVAIGGHVHDYGISVSAYNSRLGDYICTSTGGYGTGSRYLPTGGGPGTPGHPAAGNARVLNTRYQESGGTPADRYHIQEMTSCTPTPLQSIICNGDVIRLHTQYNNGSAFPISDAMGIIVADVATNLPDANLNGTIDACDSSDSDLDGFSDRVEYFAGTSRTLKCGTDAWPADVNNDGFSDITDIAAVAGDFGKSVPPAPARHNIAPDPLDTFVDITDIARMAGLFGKHC